MEKAKLITLLAIASALTVAIIGIAYAQYMTAQGLGANGYYSSVPQTSSSVQDTMELTE